MYRPKDDSLKTPGFKEAHRCAFFEYVVRHGGEAPHFPDETKALGAKYLAENDDLSVWVRDEYELTEQTQPVQDFVSIKAMYEAYTASRAYELMSKAEKRRVTQTEFSKAVKNNLLLREHYVEARREELVEGDGVEGLR
jgi:hypothetical protein